MSNSSCWASVGLAFRTLAACPRQFSTVSPILAGHSKWSKIKDKKGTTDTQKSLLYGRANRDIIVAARTGGSPDPDKNLQLATAIRKYKDEGVPKENIQRTLAKVNQVKGKGGGGVVYEAIAFGSVGIIIECLTDNPTRTIGNVKHLLSKHSARLAPVKFLFERKGLVQVSLDKNIVDIEKITEDLIEAALGAGVEDFDQQHDDENPKNIVLKFTSPPAVVAKVCSAVMSNSESSISLQTSELIYRPIESTGSTTEELESQVSHLVQDLESDEDTLRVWTSLDSR